MPRPTAAQFAYGSATVIFSTLAMLLLSRTSSGVGVAVIVLAALVLGVLVAVTVPMPRTAHLAANPGKDGAAGAAAPLPANSPDAVRISAAPVRGEQLSEHSLRS
jgi:hypothetical protein